jgi:hypothetical protein
MRPADLARLNQPYPDNVEPSDVDARAAIGVKLPRWTVLKDEIFADFTEQHPYGIGWWSAASWFRPHSTRARRRCGKVWKRDGSTA